MAQQNSGRLTFTAAAKMLGVNETSFHRYSARICPKVVAHPKGKRPYVSRTRLERWAKAHPEMLNLWRQGRTRTVLKACDAAPKKRRAKKAKKAKKPKAKKGGGKTVEAAETTPDVIFSVEVFRAAASKMFAESGVADPEDVGAELAMYLVLQPDARLVLPLDAWPRAISYALVEMKGTKRTKLAKIALGDGFVTSLLARASQAERACCMEMREACLMGRDEDDAWRYCPYCQRPLQVEKA